MTNAYKVVTTTDPVDSLMAHEIVGPGGIKILMFTESSAKAWAARLNQAHSSATPPQDVIREAVEAMLNACGHIDGEHPHWKALSNAIDRLSKYLTKETTDDKA